MNARNFFTWALLVLLPSTPSFGHEKVITAKELPAAAQTFINTHFKGKKITEAKKDVEMRKTCYDVTLDNGAKLEFDGKGAWKEIKCKSSAVPPATVPAAISKYVKANYPRRRIVKIERRLIAVEMQYGRFFDGIDVLVPVPLSANRLRQRGYNQSERLASGIREITGLPVVTKAIKRKKFVQSQTQLSRHERQENVSDMFQLKDESLLRNKHILLIDDICTTGATLTACMDVLKGIEGIRISVLTWGFTKN